MAQIAQAEEIQSQILEAAKRREEFIVNISKILNKICNDESIDIEIELLRAMGGKYEASGGLFSFSSTVEYEGKKLFFGDGRELSDWIRANIVPKAENILTSSLAEKPNNHT